MDISTPLSIQHYLRATHGAAVGLDSPPQRFLDPEVRDALDPITNIPGLALTGQDTVICGVTLCQVSAIHVLYSVSVHSFPLVSLHCWFSWQVRSQHSV